MASAQTRTMSRRTSASALDRHPARLQRGDGAPPAGCGWCRTADRHGAWRRDTLL